MASLFRYLFCCQFILSLFPRLKSDEVSRDLWKPSVRRLVGESIRKVRSECDEHLASPMDQKSTLTSHASIGKGALGTMAGDVAALLTLKSVWEDSGGLLQSWSISNMSSLCSTWLGVSCTSIGRVTSLSISGDGFSTISGSLPDAIANLTALSSLSLTDLSLSGPLPASLQHLTFLQVLNLSGNNFNGSLPYLGGIPLQKVDLRRNSFMFDLETEIPQQIGPEIIVRFLDLGSNLIRGRIPDEIGSLRLLEFLDLSQNLLSGGIPAGIGQLAALNYLDISFNSLNGSIPPELGNCTKLSVVRMHNNRLDGAILGRMIYELSPNLFHLEVQSNFLNGSIPLEFGKCRKLSILDLSQNSFSGSIPSTLCADGSNSLSILDLSSNKISGVLPESLINCQSLSVLILDDNEINGSIPPEYGSELRLRVLSATNNQISGPLPQNLTGWREGMMTNLLLGINHLSGSIPDEIGSLDYLQQVALFSNSLSGQLPPSLVNCSNLIELALYNNSLSGSLWPNFDRFVNLQNLHLQNNNLSGEIPDSFFRCVTLGRLNMTGNSLSGNLSEAVGQLARLTVFGLAHNELAGSIPISLGSLPHIQILRINNNRFTGGIPFSLRNLTSVEVLYLHGNQLSGGIPSNFIQSLLSLQRLDLSENQLSGPLPATGWEELSSSFLRLNLDRNRFSGKIPEGIGLLGNLLMLHLEKNQLSGPIPSSFEKLNSLVEFNVSYNRLSGKAPAGALLKFDASCFTGNAALCGSPWFQDCRHGISAGVIGGIVTAGVVFVVILFLAGLIYVRSSRSNAGKMVVFKDVGVKLTIETIRKATENFDDKFKLGAGFQGTVYKADLMEGTTVAVKLLGGQGRISTSLITEVKFMAKLKHRHLASIIACFVGPEEVLIVYDFVPGGDLHQYLHQKGSKNSQNWPMSYELCLGIARGLKYLHHGSAEPLVHRDIKPANILIGPDNTAQITDFGLSRFFDEASTHLSTNMAGSVGYIAPECSEGRANSKSDVYSFGVVMIEILTGCGPRSEVVDDFESVVEWAENCGREAARKFQRVGRESVEEVEVGEVLTLACTCCSKRASDRPDMNSVVKSLEELREVAPGKGEEKETLFGGR